MCFLKKMYLTSGDALVRINFLLCVAAVIRLVVDGSGIAVLPSAFVTSELENGDSQGFYKSRIGCSRLRSSLRTGAHQIVFLSNPLRCLQ